MALYRKYAKIKKATQLRMAFWYYIQFGLQIT